MGLNNVGNNLDVYPEVLVYQDVSEPPYLNPWHFGVIFCQLGRQVLDGFTNDLEVAFDSILRHLHSNWVGGRLGERNVATALGDRTQDVIWADPVS